jgi:hypothetical protein
MGRKSEVRKAWLVFMAIGIVLLLVAVNCTLGQILLDQIHTDETNTMAAEDTSWAQTYTEFAVHYNDQTATVVHATENARLTSIAGTDQALTATWAAQRTSFWLTEEAPKPPVITGINFPKEIPGNKSTMIGLLYFKDEDGDISHVVYTVVAATNFGGGTDDSPNLDSGTWRDGAIKIYLWCEGQQTVTLQAVIHDFEGNQSNPMNFTFICK